MAASKQHTNGTVSEETLARMAHDLRNPLNSISMNAELVKLKLQRSGDTEQVVTYLDRILQECKNCGALLESSTKRDDE